MKTRGINRSLVWWLCLTFTSLGGLSAQASTQTLIPAGAAWKYSDSGADLGTDWRTPGYGDSGWASGPAQLGYGDGDEATVIRSSPVYPCYYFRHTFTVADPAQYSALVLEVLRDDGCVVYLNGTEVARYNLPAGTISFNTLATTASEFGWDPAANIPNLLVAGGNVLAVEVHQANLTSTDVSFDLKLHANREITVALGSPAEGASGVSIPAVLTATATDPEGQRLTVSFYGRQAPPPVPDFALVVLPDTQKYSAEVLGGTADMFYSQVNWIRANQNALNIAYVAHVGDITDNGDRDTDLSEWTIATQAMFSLETLISPSFPLGIPYGVAVGNHDEYVLSGDTSPTTLFNQYFGVSHFQGRTYYGGYYGNNNNNHYDLFSASGLDFIVIYFEYDTTQDQAVLDWADALLKAYPNRRGIAVTHYFLNIDAGPTFGAQGAAIYDALKDNPNLFLMLCGHNHGEARRTDVYAGNTVHTLLADYQDYPNGGNGFLRIMEFSPNNDVIRVWTYSPWLDTFETDASSEFTLSYPMTMGPGYILVQQNIGVASGTASTATWTGLQAGTEYEWFVAATDGTETKTSEARRFTTASSAPPTVAITSPAEGERFPSDLASVTVTAAASDSDGTVASVQFFSGSTSLEIDTTEPYAVTADLSIGFHTLTAVATDSSGAQTVSAPVHITVGTVPAAPTGLSASARSRTEINLTWSDNSSNESGFDVYQSLGGSTFALVATTAPNITSALVTGLQPGTTYYYVVRARNNLGFADSSPASATTLANQAPSATADAYTVNDDLPLSVLAAGGVLANDTDSDGDGLLAVLTTDPAHGAVSLNADGSFVYVPSANFSGPDSFTYEARDGYGGSAVGTVTVIVNPNTLFSDGFESGNLAAGGWVVSGTATVDAAAKYAGSYGALIKRTSSISKRLSAIGPGTVNVAYARRAGGLDAGESGWVEISPDGLTWVALESVSGTTPWETKTFELNPSAPDLYLRFRANGNDGNDVFLVDEVAVTAGVASGQPTAAADNYTVAEDSALSIAVPGVLGNDTDGEGDRLTAVLASAPANGTVSLSADGSFTYTPNANFNGTDTFTYKANDGLADSSPATVSITVTPINDAPLANFTSSLTGLSVAFTDTSSDGDGSIASRAWDFGDGATSTETNPTHVYATAGTYTVTLTVMDNEGATATTSMQVTVQAAASTVSVASISYSLTGGKLNNNHLLVRISLRNSAGNPVSGAAVSATISRGTQTQSRTGTTDSTGAVVFQWSSAPSGTYTTTVMKVVATGLTWDGVTPPNSFTK